MGKFKKVAGQIAVITVKSSSRIAFPNLQVQFILLFILFYSHRSHRQKTDNSRMKVNLQAIGAYDSDRFCTPSFQTRFLVSVPAGCCVMLTICQNTIKNGGNQKCFLFLLEDYLLI